MHWGQDLYHHSSVWIWYVLVCLNHLTRVRLEQDFATCGTARFEINHCADALKFQG